MNNVRNDSVPPRRKRVMLVIGFVLLCVFGGLNYLSLLRTRPDSTTGSQLLDQGLAAMRAERYDVAFASFTQAESRGESLPAPILYDCGRAAMHLGKIQATERYLRATLAMEPNHPEANELMCALLRVGGRNWELRPFALALMREERFSAANLIALTASNLSVETGDREETAIEKFLMESGYRGNEVNSRLSQARYFMDHNLNDQALPLLVGIVDENPSQIDAQARLGYLLVQRDSPKEFLARWRALPKEAWDHPEIWMVGGLWAEREEDRRTAARCYWEVFKRHPDHPIATHRLAQVLRALGRESDAAIFSERALQLATLKTYIMEARARPEIIPSIAELLESIGRRWEALGWCFIAIGRGERDHDWAYRSIERLRSIARTDSDLVPERVNLAAKIDLSDFPAPAWNVVAQAAEGTASPAADVNRLIFEDSAQAAGVSFDFVNGGDPSRAYMFEFSGGGVAVLDYDADGWPDLYLTQGCPWPPSAESSTRQRQYPDRLFRNLGNGQFVDVTEQAGLNDPGYGQGAAAGDIDNDGITDLYVANIGPNQLCRNNGDGTFSDITAAAGIRGNEWTISALIADLNGDGSPELYDVNYLGGPKVFTEICYSKGQPIQCFPPQFPGEFDKLYRNTGDGQFEDVSESAGIRRPDGKGMGIIAADLDGSRRLSLYIANDTTPCFLYLNQTQAAGSDVRFDEQAALRGVALSESGRASSCMGIAAGDINQDNLLDLFVTNFQDEPKSLFVQGANLFFDDRIRQARLHDPGFQMEGWGTQFLDADLDGDQDLVVANGHLDDYPHSTGVNRMPTQVFRNLGSGRFAEVPAAELGPYFHGLRLGRAVARLDWDRDGRPDFCVTHLHSPFALLANRTPQPGNYLVVNVRGVASARDAIGTKVTVRTGDQEWSQQLIAGDGFQASNQRQLTFGLGKAAQVDAIQIHWPSGTDENFGPLGANAEILCIEGNSAPIQLLK